MVEDGSSARFQLNGKDFGTLEKGDKVVIEEERDVTVSMVSDELVRKAFAKEMRNRRRMRSRGPRDV